MDFFGYIFLLFSYESSQGPKSQSPGEIPGLRHFMTALCQSIVCDINPALCRYLCICCRGCCLNSLITEHSHSFSVLNRPYFDIPISHVVIHFHLVQYLATFYLQENAFNKSDFTWCQVFVLFFYYYYYYFIFQEFEIIAQIKLFQEAAKNYDIVPDEAFRHWFDNIKTFSESER